ncbi:MAG: hypothetical protein EZS28_016125 [Streblomastix strix]|uniref:Uncharacterized protein n=1 Tax=Streblomastix strix TaxID=222440 RepID=A0A5J4W0E4_9EUKA|nr:MAG: hypothetical protein EZS28_016125 [Streblomastix strix]
MVHKVFREIEETNFMLMQSQQEHEATLEKSKDELRRVKTQLESQLKEMDLKLVLFENQIDTEELKIRALSESRSNNFRMGGLTGSEGEQSDAKDIRQQSSSNEDRNISTSSSSKQGQTSQLKCNEFDSLQLGIDDGKQNMAAKASAKSNALFMFMKDVYTKMNIDSSSSTCMRMLFGMESKLLQLTRKFEQAESDQVKSALKKQDTERRDKLRGEKNRIKKEIKERNMKESLRRAKEPVHKKVGRPQIFRLQPIVNRKKQVEEEEDKIDEDAEFFVE